ncbi:MAG: helix-turn-helix transcriptional regulator [Pseudomonadota bacterium]
MTSVFDFYDKINSCASADEVDAAWQDWCTKLGFPRTGTQTTRLRNYQMKMARIRTNYPDAEVDHYLKNHFFQFSNSLNPLQKPARLDGLHLDTFSKYTSGKPDRYHDFLDFVREIKIPAEMWVRFPISEAQSISFCIWSDEEDQRLFELRTRELRQLVVPAASVALERMKSVGVESRPNETPCLTNRESDCMLLLASGLRQREIADRVSIDIKTVEMHLRNARIKLNARTTHQAIAQAILKGHIDP